MTVCLYAVYMHSYRVLDPTIYIVLILMIHLIFEYGMYSHSNSHVMVNNISTKQCRKCTRVNGHLEGLRCSNIDVFEYAHYNTVHACDYISMYVHRSSAAWTLLILMQDIII